MLNVLHPRSNYSLPAPIAFERHDPNRSRAGSHPPVADGSHRQDPLLGEYRRLDASRMGYHGAPWVGNALPHGPVAGGLAVHNGSMAVGHAMQHPSKDAYRSVPTDAMTMSTTSTTKPHSTAPPARYQPSSPVHAPEFETLGNEPIDESANQIVSYLQIPASINNSKGSLSDFAAQVRLHPSSTLRAKVLTYSRSLVSSGSNLPSLSTASRKRPQRPCPMLRW
jgi:hypothetical protein